MLAVGIILGLLAATAHSLAYLGSRWFTRARGGGFVRLLVISHVLQGAAALPLAILLYPLLPEPLPRDPLAWLLPVLGVALFYMLAQLGLFYALHHTEASRISPLLGVKIALLAAIAVFGLGDHLTAPQWGAVAIAVLAAFVLNYTGGSIPPQAVFGVLWACVGYALSDTSIRLLIEGLHPVPPLWGAIFGMAVVYAVCGVGSLPFLPWFGSRKGADWLGAAPYAASWLMAMVFLFTCFAAVGIVFGNILQSTRGIISIFIAVPLARWGVQALETPVGRGIFWRRAAAAAMMSAAIALFVTGGGRPDEQSPQEPDPRGSALRVDELP